MKDIKKYLGEKKKSNAIIRYALKFTCGDEFCKIFDLLNSLEITTGLFYTDYREGMILTLDDYSYNTYDKVSEYAEYDIIPAAIFIKGIKILESITTQSKYESHNEDRIEEKLIESNYQNERFQ